jgi:hypothetical protein
MTTTGISQVGAAPRVMAVCGGFVLAGVLLYYGFIATNSMGLAEHEGTATVVSKEYRPAGTTYRPMVIGGRTHSVPQTTGEMFLIGLSLDGDDTVFAVDRSVFERLYNGNRVPVIYRKQRLTGDLRVDRLGR